MDSVFNMDLMGTQCDFLWWGPKVQPSRDEEGVPTAAHLLVWYFLHVKRRGSSLDLNSWDVLHLCQREGLASRVKRFFNDRDLGPYLCTPTHVSFLFCTRRTVDFSLHTECELRQSGVNFFSRACIDPPDLLFLPLLGAPSLN